MIKYLENDDSDCVDVGMYQWSWVGESKEIKTMGLATCIGIAIMNDNQGLAWVLHAPNMTHHEDDLRDMLQDVLCRTSEPKHLRIVLCGGYLGDPNNRNQVTRDRCLTIQFLKEMFPETTAKEIWEEIEDFQLYFEEGAWREADAVSCFVP